MKISKKTPFLRCLGEAKKIGIRGQLREAAIAIYRTFTDLFKVLEFLKKVGFAEKTRSIKILFDFSDSGGVSESILDGPKNRFSVVSPSC